ncbi:hypothetical protein Tco_1359350 [Tanacetum coccineum]
MEFQLQQVHNVYEFCEFFQNLRKDLIGPADAKLWQGSSRPRLEHVALMKFCKMRNNGDYLLDIGCMIGERMYYPWLHYGDYDHYYFSVGDGVRCSLHDIYVEVVVTSRHLSYLRSILTPSVDNSSQRIYRPFTSFDCIDS